LKRPLLTLILLLPFLLAFKFIPQGATEAILQEAVVGQTLIFSRKYPEAIQYFSSLEKKYPQSPLGTFGLMATYNTKMFENFDFTLDQDFEEVQKRNKEIVNKIADNKNASAWDSFLCGASSGLRGFYYIRKDKVLKGLGEANQAKNCLQRALELDPKFVDPLMGLGLFDYWRSVFTNRFKFLPFFKDHRQEGIDQIKKSIQEGTIVPELATAALTFVYSEGNRAKEGLPLAENILEKYPTNIIMKNLKGNFLMLLGKYPESRNIFEEVLHEAPEINVARYYLGLNFYRTKNIPTAKMWFEQFLSHHPNPAWQAYAHYMLGEIALKQNDRSTAWKHFKEGYRAYDDYKPNLRRLLQMRKNEI
jgi:tetratricopeptide (TPR) repeat protein